MLCVMFSVSLRLVCVSLCLVCVYMCSVCVCCVALEMSAVHISSLKVDFAGIDIDFEYGKGPFSDCVPVSILICYSDTQRRSGIL